MKGYELKDDATARTVMASGALNLSGNVTPMAWFSHLQHREGRYAGQPFLLAIVLLSDLVYWYRPIEVRDEGTGMVKGYRKKFAADLLQRSQSELARQFGMPRAKIAEALNFLESEGLIFVHIEERLELENGRVLGNVQFIGIDPDGIREITTPCIQSKQGLLSVEARACIQSKQAYTETTETETSNNSLSTNKKSCSSPPGNGSSYRGEPGFDFPETLFGDDP